MGDAVNKRVNWLRVRLEKLSQTQLRIGSWRVYGAALLAALGIAGGAMLLGLVLGVNNAFPSTLISKVQNRLLTPRQSVAAPSSRWTSYLPLNVVQTQIPRERQNASGGGGLTQFREESVLLTYDGRFFSIDLEGNAERLDVAPPDNGYEDYVAYAQRPENRDRDYLTQHHRYNDILYYNDDARTGLVISYTEFHLESACMTNTIARLDLRPGLENAGDLTAQSQDWDIVHRTSPCLKMNEEPYWPFFVQMGGGRMAMADNGELVFTSGDFHRDGVYSDQNVSQDPNVEWFAP